MPSTAVDPTTTATAVLTLGALLLLAAWLARSARRRTHARLDARATLVQAEALRQQGRVTDARTLLSRAALAHPEDSAIHYRLACCCSLTGDFRAALAGLKRACDLDANWAVSAMHDPDLRALWQSGTPGTRASQWLAARDLAARRAA
jgi:predicted Zn-dependent protease